MARVQREARPGQLLEGVDGGLLLEAPAFGDVHLALVGLELALALRLVLVAGLVELVELGLGLGEALLRGDGGLEVDARVAAATALEDEVAILCEGAGIEEVWVDSEPDADTLTPTVRHYAA